MRALPALLASWSLLAATSLSAADTKTPAAQHASGWGTVRGVVQVEGELPVLPLLAQKGRTIYYRGSLLDAANGIPRKPAGLFPEDIPDRSVIVDSTSRGLANVLVYLKRRPAHVHPERDRAPTETINIVWKDWKFEPRAVVLRTGQKIIVRPASPTTQMQVYAMPNRNHAFNQLIGGMGKQSFETSFANPELLPLRVENQFGLEMARAEPPSHAYWLILDHPYAAITTSDGKFEVPDLPAGEHELTIWHERMGYVVRKFKVNVRANETIDLAPIKVANERLTPKSN
jgi:hypothetical protein